MANAATRDELYRHARQCGLDHRAATDWMLEQIQPKPPPEPFKAAKEATMMLFEPDQLPSNYRG